MTKLLKVSLLILLTATLAYAYSNEEKAQQIKEMRAAMQKIQAKMKSNPNMSKEEQKALMMHAMNKSQTIKSRIEKQKEEMPKMLTVMKYYRACLKNANAKADAKVCDQKAVIKAKELGLRDGFDEEEDFVWDKKQMLTDLDEDIAHLEHVLPCIQKAQNMTDVMQCNQKDKQ